MSWYNKRAAGHASLSAQLRRELDEVYVEPINEVMQTVGLTGYDEAVSLSGIVVDTGRYRSAWKLTLNEMSKSIPREPTLAERYAFHKSKALKGSMYEAELKESQKTAYRTAGRFDVRKHRALYISNNVSYATIIEHGSTKLPPHQIGGIAELRMNKELHSLLRKF